MDTISLTITKNRSNFEAHFEGTGPEIWRQTNGDLVAFVAGAGLSHQYILTIHTPLTSLITSSGTGGTVAGTGHFLKTMNDDVTVAIADPEGSGLYNKVKHGVLYDRKESEGTKRRHQVDTVVEGMSVLILHSVRIRENDLIFFSMSSGINRLTKNIELALPIIDDAFR